MIRLEDVLKTSWKRLEDVLKTSSEDIRLRWTYSSWSRRLEDVFWRHKAKVNIFALIKTSSEDEDERRLHQDECLLGINLQKVFNTVDDCNGLSTVSYTWKICLRLIQQPNFLFKCKDLLSLLRIMVIGSKVFVQFVVLKLCSL